MEQVKKLTRKQKIAQGLEKPNGNRKWRAAEARKAQRQEECRAMLRNYTSSPRKMRLVADQIRGADVGSALNLLQLSPKSAAKPLFKLLRSAIDNWQQKFAEGRFDAEGLYVKSVEVDVSRTLRRIRPAPQGRAYRVRKRSNHVKLMLDTMPEAE